MIGQLKLLNSRLFQNLKWNTRIYRQFSNQQNNQQNSTNSSIYKRFHELGVSKNFIDQVEQNKTISNHLEDLQRRYNDSLVSDKKRANLIISLTTKLTPTLEQEKYKLAEYIMNEQITSNADLEKALILVKQLAKIHGSLNSIHWTTFEDTMGINKGDIDQNIIINDIKSELSNIPNLNYEFVVNDNKKYIASIFRIVRDQLKSYPTKQLFNCFPQAILDYSKEQMELLKNNQNNSINKQDNNDQDGVSHSNHNTNVFIKEDNQTHIWDKIAQLKGRDLCYENNNHDVYQQHLQQRGQYSYILRFPPEPNGYLHLGHAKALRTNFYSAEKLGGICYLRFDDTNPEKEKQDYIESIIDNVKWFGFQPYAITYSSDYFEQIYQCAITLIKKNLAYVCQLTQEEMAVLRQNKQASPYRDRDIEENLRMFEDMKNGKYQENEVCLRMKIDYQHPNPTMRDPVMYRIKYHPHPRTQNKWCIYPMYDFTHCLCDSFENITHSLCTLEFEIRRDLYYWILDALNLYKPVVWEYSRLNVSNSVLSKRKLIQLIQNNVVQGWDDPRLLTINALRRRGVRPEAINAFVDLVNVARRGNENIIDQKLLDYCIRQDLDEISPRTMAILDPFKLEIINFNEFNIPNNIEIPLFPKNPIKGTRQLELSSTLLVDASDVRQTNPSKNTSSESTPNNKININEDKKNNQSKRIDKDEFIGLYPGSKVSLKYFGLIEVLEVNMKEKRVSCKLLSLDEKDRRNAVGQIHWLNPSQAINSTLHLYHPLFSVPDPNSYHNILDAVNHHTLTTYHHSFISKDLINLLQQYQTFQFERLGYFTVDKKLNNNSQDQQQNQNQQSIVFHRTVSLKDRVNRDNL